MTFGVFCLFVMLPDSCIGCNVGSAPSTRGGSEEGSPRPPRREVRRPSWYVQQYGPHFATLDDLEVREPETLQTPNSCMMRFAFLVCASVSS